VQPGDSIKVDLARNTDAVGRSLRRLKPKPKPDRPELTAEIR
jgi:hypothetical protein